MYSNDRLIKLNLLSGKQSSTMQLGIAYFLLVFIAKYSKASVDELTCNTIERKNGELVGYNTCLALRYIETYQCTTPQLADGEQCIKYEQYEAHSRFYPCVPFNLDLGDGIKGRFEVRS